MSRRLETATPTLATKGGRVGLEDDVVELSARCAEANPGRDGGRVLHGGAYVVPRHRKVVATRG